MRITKETLSILVLVLLTRPSFSQKTFNYSDISATYREGVELYDREKYVAASDKFSKVEKQLNEYPFDRANDDLSLLKTNAEYYSAVCALELFNDNAETLLLNFVEKHPENSNAGIIFFQIGRFYYRREKYDRALEWFARVDEYDLSEKEFVEFKFKVGYSGFKLKNYKVAGPAFDAVKGLVSKYSYPATYYRAYIAYEEKDYEAALKGFQYLKESKVYAEVVPLYICRIYYESGRYDELIAYAKDVIGKVELKNEAEVYNLLAQAFFKKDNYAEAAVWFEKFCDRDSLHAITHQDSYAMGFSYFKTGRTDKAIATLERLGTAGDIYAQSALFTLGECFLKKEDKPAALSAFRDATKLYFSTEIRQEALFNYAKLSYELSYHQVAVSSFQEFIRSYPTSFRINEAKSLLGEVLLTTKNYKDALAVLESITSRNSNANLAYQRVAYYRGVEVFNDNNPAGAIALFDKSLEYPIDKSIEVRAWFWKAEALYRQSYFNEAILNYRKVMESDEATDLPAYAMAGYGAGYACFMKGEYSLAATNFEKFLHSTNTSKRLADDATLRLADCRFVMKDYEPALANYTKVINVNGGRHEYAMFQKAMIYGLQNKLNDKIVLLQGLLNGFNSCDYCDDAQYELSYTQFVLNQPKEALEGFNRLVQVYPQSSYVPRAKLSIGLIYYNQNEDEKALVIYKSIVTEYPGTEDAREALQLIRNIYVEAGNADEYVSYANSIAYASVSPGELDSVTYRSAFNRYARSDYDNAVKGFSSYLDKYKEGFFVIDATYYRAECLVRTGKYEEALEGYRFVLSRQRGAYTEKSLLNSARILTIQKKYLESAEAFRQLEQNAEFKESYTEAIAGAMKAYAIAGKDEDALMYAKMVRQYEKSSSENINLAYLYSAKYQYKTGQADSALAAFTYIVTNTKTETGAEARYMIAVIQYEKGDYLASQNSCFELGNQIPSYEFWVAKAFILLADNYLRLDNEFQARSTLQSIIDEYSVEDDGIKADAKQKLEALAVPK